MRALVTAGIRIIVIFCFLQALVYLLTNISNLTYGFSRVDNFFLDVGILLVVFLLIFLVLWVVWWKAGPIAGFLAGNIEENQITINTTNTDLIKTVMRVLGICLVFLTLPTLLGHIAYHFSYVRLMESNGLTSREATEMMWWVTDGAKILIGLWLMLGGHGIVTAIDRIWNAARMTDKGEGK